MRVRREVICILHNEIRNGETFEEQRKQIFHILLYLIIRICIRCHYNVKCFLNLNEK